MDDPNVNNTAVVIINVHIAAYQAELATLGPLGRQGALDCINALTAVRADIIAALEFAAQPTPPAAEPSAAPDYYGKFEWRFFAEPEGNKLGDWYPIETNDGS